MRTALSKLRDDQASNPDWHRCMNDVGRDAVHLSLYPLVYGRNRVFSEEIVAVDDAIGKWAGKGTVIPPHAHTSP